MVADPVINFLTNQKPIFRIVFVLFGAVMIYLSLGTYHTFGNMLPYMASYMRNYTDSSIRIEQLMWIPMFQGCFPFAMVIGGWFALKYSSRIAAAIGCFLMSLGVFLSTWSINYSYWCFLFTYGFMFGLGQGIAYVVVVACVINWAPQMIGLASGIVAAAFGISSSIFAPIQTHLINPENFASTKDGYFTQKELLLRVPSTFFRLSIIYFLMQCIGLIFICDPPIKKLKTKIDYVSENEVAVELYDNESHLSNSSTSSSNQSEILYTHLNICNTSNISCHSGSNSVLLTTNQMLKSSTFYFLFVSLFCCSFYSNMFYNYYKTFGETFISDDFFMAIAFSVGSVANAFARIAWGFLTDCTSFQVTLSFATSWASILLLTMPITVFFGKYIYLLWLIMMFVCMGATHALFITAIVYCFGSRHKSRNYGYLIFSTTLSGTFLAMLSQYFLNEIGFKWLFIFTAVFPFVAFILTSAIQMTPQGYLIV